MLNVKALLTKILTKLDAHNTNYIIDEGVTGSWRYRKWQNGVCELWQRKGVSRNGNNTKIEFTFPWAFTYAPIITVSAGATGNINAYAAYTGSTTTGCEVYVNASSGSQVWASVYAIEVLGGGN